MNLLISGLMSALACGLAFAAIGQAATEDRKSTRLNSSHQIISYAVFCLKKKNAIRIDGGSIPLCYEFPSHINFQVPLRHQPLVPGQSRAVRNPVACTALIFLPEPTTDTR